MASLLTIQPFIVNETKSPGVVPALSRAKSTLDLLHSFEVGYKGSKWIGNIKLLYQSLLSIKVNSVMVFALEDLLCKAIICLFKLRPMDAMTAGTSN